MAKPGAWIVVPAYNEGAMIPHVAQRLVVTFDNVVIVDDGSRDATFEALANSGVHRLRHTVNLGQGAALQTGITYALANGAEYVVTFDADGQMREEDVIELLRPLENRECDVTLGSRFRGAQVEMPRSRRLLLKAAVLFTRATTRLELTDTHNGLRAFTGDAAKRLDIRQNRMAHASEILNEISRLGLRYREVPVTIRYTAYSMKKGQRFWGMFGILWDLIFGRTGA